MRALERACAVVGIGLLLCLSACKADIPDGVFACDVDRACPSGFTCSARGGDPKRYCFSSDGTSDGDDSGIEGRSDGGPADAGEGSNTDGAVDGGSADGGAAQSIEVRSAGFWSGGALRGADGYVLHDDGFDRGERLCTTGRELCVTGGFSP
jgi:hypothetical protein